MPTLKWPPLLGAGRSGVPPGVWRPHFRGPRSLLLHDSTRRQLPASLPSFHPTRVRRRVGNRLLPVANAVGDATLGSVLGHEGGAYTSVVALTADASPSEWSAAEGDGVPATDVALPVLSSRPGVRANRLFTQGGGGHTHSIFQREEGHHGVVGALTSSVVVLCRRGRSLPHTAVAPDSNPRKARDGSVHWVPVGDLCRAVATVNRLLRGRAREFCGLQTPGGVCRGVTRS